MSNVAFATNATAAVTVDQIVLSSAARRVQLSVQANAVSFTPPIVGATTWNAADVSWNAAVWANGAGAAGTLSNLAFNPVVLSAADPGSVSTAALQFTLAANAAVRRSGSHTLVMTWRVEAL